MSKKLFYKIGEACKLLDIQPYVLRYWETEFPFLSPGKSKSGQRVYSAKEIEIIRRIKVLLYEEGYTIAGAKKRLETDLPGILQSDSIDDLEIDDELFAAAAARRPKPCRPSPAAGPPEAAAGGGRPSRRFGRSAGYAGPRRRRWPSSPRRACYRRFDTGAALKIKTLRAGIEHALGEAQAILALLETPAGAPQRASAARR